MRSIVPIESNHFLPTLGRCIVYVNGNRPKETDYGHTRNPSDALKRVVQPLSAFSKQNVKAVSEALNGLLADAFTLYLKTKNFHWHVSGPHFRGYHWLFDEQAGQVLETTDALAERVRKIGAVTLHSIGEIARMQRIRENEEESVPASRMLSELRVDNEDFAAALRAAHRVCEAAEDIASTSLIENWVDEAERRVWFLREAASADELRIPTDEARVGTA